MLVAARRDRRMGGQTILGVDERRSAPGRPSRPPVRDASICRKWSALASRWRTCCITIGYGTIGNLTACRVHRAAVGHPHPAVRQTTHLLRHVARRAAARVFREVHLVEDAARGDPDHGRDRRDCRRLLPGGQLADIANAGKLYAFLMAVARVAAAPSRSRPQARVPGAGAVAGRADATLRLPVPVLQPAD